MVVADLHCHTKISDGSTGIDELIYIAQKRRLQVLAVTDHDTFAGSTRAVIYGKRHGVEVIPGAEISTFDYKRGRKAHILCYLCENPDRLEGLFKRTAANRRAAATRMMQKVMHLYPISPEMVSRRAQGSTNIYKQHIMHTLMDAGYADSVFGELFHKLFNSKTGLAYVEVEYPEVREVIGMIHDAGGLAVLAHPAVYDSYDLMAELVEYGLDGVEVWHPRNREGDDKLLQLFAQQHGLFMTGGTDFHGMYTKHPFPPGTCVTPGEQLEAMKKRKEAIKKFGKQGA